MIDNKFIVSRIRILAERAGMKNDSEICRRCGFDGRGQIRNILKIKTAPQLDTLEKFAKGLDVRIEDIIYNRTDADIAMSRSWDELTEYEKTEVNVYIKMLLREKNEKQQKVA